MYKNEMSNISHIYRNGRNNYVFKNILENSMRIFRIPAFQFHIIDEF